MQNGYTRTTDYKVKNWDPYSGLGGHVRSCRWWRAERFGNSLGAFPIYPTEGMFHTFLQIPSDS